MGNRIYVGNLPFTTTTEELRTAFAPCGQVTDAKVMTDRETGQSRGFGFVTFASDAEATSAINQMNGSDHGGRRLVVNEARERPAGNGQGRQGGFNNGGGYSSDTGRGGDRRGDGGDRRGDDGRGRRGRDRRDNY